MEYKKPFIDDITGEKLKEEYIGLFEKEIIPFYSDARGLLDWIEESDFFEAPASTQYHLCCKYGLVKHSLNVHKRLKEFIQVEYGDNFEEYLGVNSAEVALIGLCHDVCKADCYLLDMRNVKDESGNWIKEPYYKYSPAFEYGHGEKSVFIVQSFIRGLSLNTTLAIRYHMGAAGNTSSPLKDSDALKAMEEFPIIMWTNVADLTASYIDEKREEK